MIHRSAARFALVYVAFVAAGVVSAHAQTPAQNRDKAVVRRLFDEVANRGRLDVADVIFSPRFVLHGNPPDAGNAGTGPDVEKEHIRSLRTAFPDIKFTILDMVANQGKVAVRWTFEGTNTGQLEGTPPTNKHVSVAGMHFFRLVNGKIDESWAVADWAGMLRQLNPPQPQ